ncbi:MAG: cytochrome C oxidase subunit IV family protein [Rhodanobacter sp.]
MSRRARSHRYGNRGDAGGGAPHQQEQRQQRGAYIWEIGLTVAVATVLATWQRYRRHQPRAGVPAGADKTNYPHSGVSRGNPHGGIDMHESDYNSILPAELQQQETHEFHSYVWGISLALVLTLIPFGLVKWAGIPRFSLLIVIGACALLQLVAHFRFFLHIGFKQKREDLLLILFSALLLFLMVAGTIWIMGNLAQRMAMPMSMPAGF